MPAIPARVWALIALSGALQILIFPIAGPVPLWRTLLCWMALAPLLIAILGNGGPLRLRQAALLGYLCGFLWYLGNCYWIYQTMYLYGDLPKLVSLGILVLFALYLGLYYAFFAVLLALLRRGRWGVQGALLAAPFAWVSLELARARITGFPWDLLGYSQVDNGLLTMLSPVGGVMLMSFVIVAVNSLFAAAALAPQSKRTLLAGALVLAAAAQLGALYHSPADDPDSQHYATLLQENLAVGAEGHAEEALSAEQKYRQFIAWSKAPNFQMEQGTPEEHWMPMTQPNPPDLIVWPEAPADFISIDAAFRSQMSGLARSADSTVVAGDIGVEIDPHAENGYHEYGSASVFSRNGSPMGRYDKIHRVPWGEYVPFKQLFFFAGKLVSGVGNFSAGTQHSVFHANGRSFSVFICYESIFGDEVRRFVQDGAEVLVNISDDGWYGDTGAPWQHLNMARMRAIENRRWLLRDTNTGVTTAIDPHGRGVFTTPRHIRAAFAFPFDYRSDKTLYTRFGDWFAWLCTLATIVALLLTRKPVQ